MQDVEILTRKGRIETAFSIARNFVYGDRWQRAAAWCDECESYSPMVTASTAAMLDKTTCDDIASRVETRQLHHWKMPGDKLFVCLSSLLDPSQ